MSAIESQVPLLEPFVRSKKGCLQLITSEYWGSWYRSIEDPKGKEVDPKELLNQFWLKPDFNRVPLVDLRRIVTFYRKYISQLSANSTFDTNEVQVLLLRSETDVKIWKILVPKQIITPATVEAITHPSCDLETGEDYDVFPPVGWVHAGSSHSHNTMAAFFSGKDDRGELTVPGLHFVIGHITADSYDIKASIVINRARFLVPPDRVLETGDIPYVTNDALVARFTDSEVVPYAPQVESYVKKAQEVRKVAAVKPYNYTTSTKEFGSFGRRRRRSLKNAPYSWTPGVSPNNLDDFSNLLEDSDQLGVYAPSKTVTVTGRPQLLSNVAFDLAEILKSLKYSHPEVVFDALVKHRYLSAEEALNVSLITDINVTHQKVYLTEAPSAFADDAEWSADPLDTSFMLLTSLLSDLEQEAETKEIVYGMLAAHGFPDGNDKDSVAGEIGFALVAGMPITGVLPEKENLVKLTKTLNSLLKDDEYARVVCGILVNLGYLEVEDLCRYLPKKEIQRGIVEAYDYTLTFTDSDPELSAMSKLPEPDWSDFT
jgi:hypothetical protein